jgi:hypothetical protein
VIAAAKRHILRGYRNQYIPGWNHQCDKHYERFNSDYEKESAVRLLQVMNKQRKPRCEYIVEKTNFKHSSRKAWKLLKKLGTNALQIIPPKIVAANNIVSRLLCVSKASMDKNHARATKASIRGLKVR